jgi:hypothetical protein
MTAEPRSRRAGFAWKAAGVGAAGGALFGAYAALLPFALGPDPEAVPTALKVAHTAAAALAVGGWPTLLVGFALMFGLALGAAVGAALGATVGRLIAHTDRDPAA